MGHYDGCRGYKSCGHHESVPCDCAAERLAHMRQVNECNARIRAEREALYAQPDVRRFMRYVEKLPSGCWYWTGARSRGRGNRKWYGSFRVGRRTMRAHRFACEVLGGRECPPEHHRDHTCHFSMCVNPDHIEVVHRVENQRRMMERRRDAQGR